MTTDTLSYIREESFVQKLVRIKLFWIFFFLITFSYPIYRSMNRELPPELPRLGKVPAFSLTNGFGKPFGSKDLEGRIYMASFMFTSCPTTCPGLIERMKVAQKRLKGLGQKVALLSISVDPAFDTPEVLFKYARKTKANPYVWHFLTGERKDLRALLIDGFKVPMGEKEPVEGVVGLEKVSLLDIVHSEQLVLVDTEGMIRGYYPTDRIGMDKLMIDVGLLVNRKYN
ncbi:MAG: SCO family protein [Bacteriovoracaceae bacterium]|nr:SCO family protein [Bacteriovoracaceae bacterium]